MAVMETSKILRISPGFINGKARIHKVPRICGLKNLPVLRSGWKKRQISSPELILPALFSSRFRIPAQRPITNKAILNLYLSIGWIDLPYGNSVPLQGLLAQPTICNDQRLKLWPLIYQRQINRALVRHEGERSRINADPLWETQPGFVNHFFADSYRLRGDSTVEFPIKWHINQKELDNTRQVQQLKTDLRSASEIGRSRIVINKGQRVLSQNHQISYSFQPIFLDKQLGYAGSGLKRGTVSEWHAYLNSLQEYSGLKAMHNKAVYKTLHSIMGTILQVMPSTRDGRSTALGTASDSLRIAGAPSKPWPPNAQELSFGSMKRIRSQDPIARSDYNPLNLILSRPGGMNQPSLPGKEIQRDSSVIEKSSSSTAKVHMASNRLESNFGPFENSKPAPIDLSRLSDQIYGMIERKIKMERERRGIYVRL